MTTTTTDTTDVTTIIETYLEAYSEPDAARRDGLVAEVWAEDGALVDPPLDGAGRAAISEMAATVQTHYPAHRFVRTSGIDAHHSFARYQWALVAPDGTQVMSGTDVAELTADGSRLQRVVGFIGEIPPKD